MELNTIYTGDALEVLQTLPDDSVDCCVTSPPYYGLRDYGTATWVGGNPECKHYIMGDGCSVGIKQETNRGSLRIARGVCPTCGARRIDHQIGLEDTPEVYIIRLQDVFREVRRVLKPAGTFWLNVGDSYAGSGRGKGDINRKGYKNKDLVGIPWLLAFALRADGWYLRQDIIWHKPNPMPESVTDRCTKAHEYIFLLSKSKKYHFDSKAIQEDAVSFADMQRRVKNGFKEWKTKKANSTYSVHNGKNGARSREELYNKNGKRNKRDVWTVNTKPYREAHFATYPEALITDCIKAGCPPDGVILDPFMGAGTTALVARKLGRNYVGIELNPEYVEMANKRLAGRACDFLDILF